MCGIFVSLRTKLRPSRIKWNSPFLKITRSFSIVYILKEKKSLRKNETDVKRRWIGHWSLGIDRMGVQTYRKKQKRRWIGHWSLGIDRMGAQT